MADRFPRTQGSELETLLLVAPAQSASFAGGTPIVLQVRTHPDDGQLILTVSRSAALSACGVLGSDVTMKFFKPTADSSLSQGPRL